jgi:hypothetical protein
MGAGWPLTQEQTDLQIALLEAPAVSLAEGRAPAAGSKAQDGPAVLATN